jgi:hypothetical protein
METEIPLDGKLPEDILSKLKGKLVISEDIDTEVDRAAYEYGYYAILAEKAEAKYQKLKHGFECWLSDVEHAANRQRDMEDKRMFSEAQMKAHVRTQPKYRAFMNKLLEVDEDRKLAKVLARAMELKKDMVQSKSANRRSEMNR